MLNISLDMTGGVVFLTVLLSMPEVRIAENIFVNPTLESTYFHISVIVLCVAACVPVWSSSTS